MTVGASLLPRRLAKDIQDAIEGSGPAWAAIVAVNLESVDPAARPLAVKYLPTKYASSYRIANSGLFIGSKSFTWGRGVYVTGVVEPLSTAIYGRAGIVARFDPTGWHAFDARDPANQQLYLRWLQAQADYEEAVLTVHSEYWLQEFRNLFREQFHIDVVLFRPDETDIGGWYTKPDDTWMAVSDWKGGSTLMTGYSNHFYDARLTILIEEEFAPDDPALTRSPQFAISGAAPADPNLPAAVRIAYTAGAIERVPS